MKTAVVLSCALLLVAVSAPAQDIYTASMRQARGAVAKTEAASNQNPDGQPQSQNGTGAAQPMDPALAATLKNIASLRADLNSLSLTNPLSGAFTNDLAAAAGGTKPPWEKIEKLAEDLQTAVAGKPALRSHFQKLAQYLHAVFNGAHLTPAKFQMISDGVEQILENNGATYEATEVVLADMKAVDRATQ